MSHLQAQVVVGLGEVLWDCLPDGRLPGGAPANVAYHANQLGCLGIICSRVGTDVLGDEYLEFAASRNLKTDWIQRDAQHCSGRAEVQLDAQGQPAFVIHDNVAWDHLQATPDARALIRRAAAVCFGTLAQRAETARTAIHDLLAEAGSDCLVVYDVNLRQEWYQRAWIEASLARADVVKLNHEEALVLSRLLELEEDRLPDIATAVLQRYEMALVCITRGAQGSLLVTHQACVDQPGTSAETGDTVGAGDAFTAALIYSHWQNWDLSHRGQFANQIAGLVASRSGAMPDLTAEFFELRRQFGDHLR